MCSVVDGVVICGSVGDAVTHVVVGVGFVVDDVIVCYVFLLL